MEEKLKALMLQVNGLLESLFTTLAAAKDKLAKAEEAHKAVDVRYAELKKYEESLGVREQDVKIIENVMAAQTQLDQDKLQLESEKKDWAAKVVEFDERDAQIKAKEDKLARDQKDLDIAREQLTRDERNFIEERRKFKEKVNAG